MAPVCRLIRADRGYVTRGDGEETATAYRACLGVGDGDVGMEGEAERVGVAGQTIRHFWGSELFYTLVDPGQEPRHVGTIELPAQASRGRKR